MMKLIKQISLLIISLFMICLLQSKVFAADPYIRYFKQVGATKDSVTVEWSTSKKCEFSLGLANERSKHTHYKYYNTGMKLVSDNKFPVYRQTINNLTSRDSYFMKLTIYKNRRNGFGREECDFSRTSVVTQIKNNQTITLKQKKTSKNTVKLDWNLLRGVSGYKVCTQKDNKTVVIKDIDSYYCKSSTTVKWSDITGSVFIVPYKSGENYSTGKYKFIVDGTPSNRISKTDIKPAKVDIKTLDYKLFSCDHSCTVGWSEAVDGALESYEIEIRDTSSKLLAKETYNSPSFKLLLPRSNTVFKIRVRAFFYTGNGKRTYGDWSDYNYIIPQPKMSSYKTSKNVKLTWDKINDCSYYKVFVSDSESGKYKQLKKTSANYISINANKYKGKYFHVVAYVQNGLKTYKSCNSWKYQFK